MFTIDQIANISKDEFAKLSADNKELILKILSEYKEHGQSTTLKELWEVDYDEVPVSIDEFIENERYLGKPTRNGKSIYPYWRKKYREIFNPALAYEEVIFTGAIGVGKTKTADVCLAYLLYRLMCLKNPQQYFKMNEGEEISIFFLNINLTLAEGVGFNTLHKMLIDSPWFMERGTVTGRVKERYNPPNHITIKFGSKSDHALGQQCYCALMDEADFSRGAIKGNSALDAKNEIMKTYNAIKERMNSRFIKNGVQYGRLFLVSSKKSDQDFIEAYIKKMKAEGQDKHMLIIDEPQWVIKPEGTFSKEKFPVAVGNKSLKSMILPDQLSKEEEEAYKKQGYRILWVPVNLKQSFVLDVNTALMNLAGISVVGATTFFNYDMFSKCYIKDYKNPFVTEVLTIGLNDDLQIADFFELDKVPEAVRYMPQFIHIDGALTGDKAGISSVGVSGLKETQQYVGAQEFISSEMTYKHIFSVDIEAPKGSEISFEKTRQFIYYLRQCGFNIVGISLDGFQSADMKQMLLTQGYDASIVSLDRTPQGYLALRSAMNDGRIGLIQIDLLEKELIELQRDVQTGKIDHPDSGCFVGETKISLVDGRSLSINELLIEQRYKTNYVYTVNVSTGKIEAKPIKKVFQTKLITNLVEITLDNNEKILCTPEHRFMLRDGSYLEAEKLKNGTSLMPLYTKIGKENNYKDYRYVYNPFTDDWELEHKEFCSNYKNGFISHHRNFNKLDNRPCNLLCVSRSDHMKIHNKQTKDYNIVSQKVSKWHTEMKGTNIYNRRNEKVSNAVKNHLKNCYSDYVSQSEIESLRIQKIEDIYGVIWEELSCRDKNRYGVMLSRNYPEYKKRKSIKNPDDLEIQKRKKLSEATKRKRWITNGKENKYIDKEDIIPDGFWFGRTQDIDSNHKVINVRKIHKPCRVYDIEVEDNHNFALTAGVFVHNSKDMADSLAGALFNATIHKQSLVDNHQLLSTAIDTNMEVDAQQEFLDNMQESLLQNSHMSGASKMAADKIEELIGGFGAQNILSW